ASLKRSALAPDAPTFAEAGFAIEASNWVGLLAPSKTPSTIIDRVSQDMARAAQAPDVRERFATAGSEVASLTPSEFSALIRLDIANFAKVVRAANVKPE
ncbi:MAG: tripartite tricarboxylate transporter substrate binding protein, partial [Proteobacteria bacterium]|nr:tripartite tricarboxylate transporter substrate binding protein [Burkholderiales bacterium]